jgi:hypothetical protein
MPSISASTEPRLPAALRAKSDAARRARSDHLARMQIELIGERSSEPDAARRSMTQNQHSQELCIRYAALGRPRN